MQYLFFWTLNVRFTTDRFIDGELRMGQIEQCNWNLGTYKNNQRMVNPFQIGAIISFEIKGVPRGVGGEHWIGSIPSAGNLKKLLIWMKIHGLLQKS